MSSLQVYNFPVILPDLRKEESLRQIADVLDYLDNVANDVFTKISGRVAENRDRLAEINSRVNTAQARVDKIKSSQNKATKVFSSSKFPAPKDVAAYQTIYKQDGSLTLSTPAYSNLKNEAKFIAVDSHLLQEKMHFYDVRVKVTKRRTKRATDEDEEAGEGLGGLPSNITSVSSMLLFNTTENPYKKYSMIDPLLGAQTKTRKSVEEDEARALAEAPTSIQEGEHIGRAQQKGYFYTPGMGEVPDIEAPSLLNLPGVAADEMYDADLPSIAPSAPGGTIPDLPAVGGEGAPDAASGPPAPPSASSAASPPPPPASSGAPPPPPPPPPPAEGGPPPPPPTGMPPAGPPPSFDAAPSADDGDDDGDDDGGGGGGRSALLDSIRNAGGGKLKLKSAKDRKLTKKAAKEEKSAASGGDLMGDLMSKLTLRRKGISGSKKAAPAAAEGDGDDGPPAPPSGQGAMDKISKMIPPPRARSSTDGGGSGDDWED